MSCVRVWVASVLLVFFAGHLVGVDGFFGFAARDAGASAVHVGADHGVRGIALHHLLEGELHGRVGGEACVEGTVVDLRGVQLLVEPGLEAHGADALEIAGGGAVGEAVEDLQNPFVTSEWSSGAGFCD